MYNQEKRFFLIEQIDSDKQYQWIGIQPPISQLIRENISEILIIDWKFVLSFWTKVDLKDDVNLSVKIFWSSGIRSLKYLRSTTLGCKDVRIKHLGWDESYVSVEVNISIYW